MTKIPNGSQRLCKSTLFTKYSMDRMNLVLSGRCYTGHHNECKGMKGKCECECHHG